MNVADLKRAFIAGMILMQRNFRHIATTGSELVQAVEASEGFKGESGGIVVMQHFDSWRMADERNEYQKRAGGQGIDLFKPMKLWSVTELRAGTAAMSIYREYLKRELKSVEGYLSCEAIQSDPALKHNADNAGIMLAEHTEQSCDPEFSARLLRRMAKESNEMAAQS